MLGILPFQLLSFPSAPREAKVFAWFNHVLPGQGGCGGQLQAVEGVGP